MSHSLGVCVCVCVYAMSNPSINLVHPLMLNDLLYLNKDIYFFWSQKLCLLKMAILCMVRANCARSHYRHNKPYPQLLTFKVQYHFPIIIRHILIRTRYCNVFWS